MAYMSSCRDADSVLAVLSANVIFTCETTFLNGMLLLQHLLLKVCWHGSCPPLAGLCLTSASRLTF